MSICTNTFTACNLRLEQIKQETVAESAIVVFLSPPMTQFTSGCHKAPAPWHGSLPITTRRNTINRLNITENAVRKISIEISIGISIQERKGKEKKKKDKKEKRKRRLSLRPARVRWHNFLHKKGGRGRGPHLARAALYVHVHPTRWLQQGNTECRGDDDDDDEWRVPRLASHARHAILKIETAGTRGYRLWHPPPPPGTAKVRYAVPGAGYVGILANGTYRDLDAARTAAPGDVTSTRSRQFSPAGGRSRERAGTPNLI